MGGVEVVVEEAVALGGGEGLDLALVVGGAVDLVGRGPAGQAFPLQQAGQFGVGGVVVEGAPGELPDVLQVRSGRGYRGGELVQLVAEHGAEQGLLVAEVVVQAFLVDPGPFGDAGHGGAVEAALGELDGRRFLQAAAGALGVPGHGPTISESNTNVAVVRGSGISFLLPTPPLEMWIRAGR